MLWSTRLAFGPWSSFVSITCTALDGLTSNHLVAIKYFRSQGLEQEKVILCNLAICPWIADVVDCRKINSPYKGTLSSYGYVLLVIYFLVHVKNPPVLPNLQQMPPLRPISKVRYLLCMVDLPCTHGILQEDTHLNGHNIWYV